MAGDGGYMLISLMLVFALMAVALLAVLPSMKQQVQRDRENELRHRGTMYMRAIQRFYKKVGRYPTSFEELGAVQPYPLSPQALQRSHELGFASP